MTQLEKNNIKEVLSEWAQQAIERDSYPIIMIAMKSPEDVMISRSREYPPAVIKTLLEECIKNLQP